MSLPLGSRFGMQQPEAWLDLTTRTANLLDDPSLDEETRISLLYRTADTLDNETVDGCRYYGIGLGICELAKNFRDPLTLENSINDRAARIVRRHQGYCARYSLDSQRGLRIGELVLPSTLSSEDAAHNAADQMAPTDKLTTDILSSLKDTRDLEDASGICGWVRDPKRLLASAKGNTARSLNQFPSAASALTVMILQRLCKRGEPTYNPDDPAYNPPLNEVIDAEKFRKLDILKIAAFSAALRLDEFETLDNYLTTDGQGITSFNRASVPDTPKSLDVGPTNVGLIHEERLRCPALYVNGMIDLSLKYVREAGIRADEDIRGQ